MAELTKWAVTAQGLTVSGVLLTNLIIILVSLHRGWMVPGRYYQQVLDERKEDRARIARLEAEALVVANETKAKLTRLEEQFQFLIQMPPLRNRPENQ